MNILILSISLSLDAFSVSICKGLSIKRINKKDILKVGLYFGIFQAIMPLIGYFLGISFYRYINNVSGIIAFILLSFIGISMIKESFEVEELNDSLDFKEMIMLSIATSIDALVVGITLGILKTNIFISILVIGLITFINSCIGVIIGNRFGSKYTKLSILGGIILILLGLKHII